MSHNYLVNFSFAHPKSDLRPEAQRWGHGSMPINTDKVPETEEDFKEIARTIGKQGGYERVAINLPLQPTDKFVEDRGEILEGLIVND